MHCELISRIVSRKSQCSWHFLLLLFSVLFFIFLWLERVSILSPFSGPLCSVPYSFHTQMPHETENETKFRLDYYYYPLFIHWRDFHFSSVRFAFFILTIATSIRTKWCWLIEFAMQQMKVTKNNLFNIIENKTTTRWMDVECWKIARVYTQISYCRFVSFAFRKCVRTSVLVPHL